MQAATSLLAVLACSTVTRAEAQPGPVAGFPGYQQQKFQIASRRAQARSLIYRQTPKVDNLQSSVHELYQRPYNYVSYEMGGSAGGSQYKYQYQTHHPQYPAYKTTNTYENPQPTYHKTPTPTYQSPAPTPVYHTTPAPTYHKPSPTYSSPTPASYYHQPSPTYSPTYHYQPYTYQTTPAPEQPPSAPAYQSHSAVVVLSGDSGVSGVIRFHQTGGPPSPVSVSGNVTGLSAGPHGFHVHQLGDTSGGCKSTGGHFNPLQLRHGAPGDLYRHVGDLGNILAGEDGVAVVSLEDTQLSLTGLASIVGRGVVVHAGMDDLGRGGDEGSLKTGNAGGRVACGVIGLAGN